MFHLCFGLSDHLKALLDFVFGSRRRVKKVRIFRAWFSQKSGVVKSSEDEALEGVRERLRVKWVWRQLGRIEPSGGLELVAGVGAVGGLLCFNSGDVKMVNLGGLVVRGQNISEGEVKEESKHGSRGSDYFTPKGRGIDIGKLLRGKPVIGN